MSITPSQVRTTVPLSGPARGPQAVPATGLDALGQAVSGLGVRLERARQVEALTAARTRMIEGIGALDAELRTDPDGAGMPERYGARLEALRGEVFTPDLPGPVARALRDEFAREQVTVTTRARTRAVALGGDRVMADLTRGLDTLVQRISVEQNPAVAEALRADATRMIGDAVAGGFLPAERAASLEIGLDDAIADTAALRLVTEDPARAAAVLAEPGALGLGERDRLRYLDRARQRVEAEQRVARTALAREVDTAVRSVLSGWPVATDDLAARVAGTDLAAPLEAAVAAREIAGDFFAASPARRAALLQSERANVRDEGQRAVVGYLEQIDRNATELLTRDPVAYGQRAGLVPQGQLDIGQFEAVAARIAAVDALAGRDGIVPQYLSRSEKDVYARAIADGTVDDRLALAASITGGFGDRAHAVLDHLGEDNALFAHAGHLMVMTGEREAATLILRGQALLDGGTMPALERPDRLVVLGDTIGRALDEAPPALRVAIEQAATAIFAATTRETSRGAGSMRDGALRTGIDPTDAYADAVQRAAGQLRVGNRTYGGFQRVNGEMTLLPVTLEAATVEESLAAMTVEDWQAVSVSGGPLLDGETPVAPGRVVLSATPGGHHRVGVMQRGRVEWLRDPRSDAPGQAFLIDLEAAVYRGSARRGIAESQAAAGRARLMPGAAGVLLP